MQKLSIDLSNALSFVNESEYQSALQRAISSNEDVEAKTGAGNDYLGWVDLPAEITNDHLEKIKSTAAKIADQSEVLVVVGIGGSYLGAKAVIEGLSHSFRNNLTADKRNGPEIDRKSVV